MFPLDTDAIVGAEIRDPARRRKYLGGSEVAAVQNIDPWTSRYALYLMKVGELEPERGNAEAMYWGTVLEQEIATAYAVKMGVKLRRSSRFYVNRLHPFIGLHPDRLVVGDPTTALECKNVTEWKAGDWGDEFTDEIPDHYKPQGYQYFICMPRLERVRFAALIGGNKHRIYELLRDDCTAEIQKAYDDQVEFWQMIQTRTPPIPETVAECDLAYPEGSGAIPVNDEILSVAARMAALRENIAVTKEQADQCGVQIRKYMAESDVLVADDLTLATWRAGKNGRRSFKLKDENVRRFLHG